MPLRKQEHDAAGGVPRQAHWFSAEGRIRQPFLWFGLFRGLFEGFYDALIVDESHRLMTKTIYDKGENQVKEIIHASKLACFSLMKTSA